MAFFMLENLKEIGHFSRLHGYNGKLVISFIKEKSSILNKETTIWVEDSNVDPNGGECRTKPACTAHESTHYLVKDETCICPSEGEGEKSEEKVVKEG